MNPLARIEHKSEIRISKSETSTNCQNQNDQTTLNTSASDLFRISCLVLRIPGPHSPNGSLDRSVARVFAEDLAHHRADLADGGIGLDRLDCRRDDIGR